MNLLQLKELHAKQKKHIQEPKQWFKQAYQLALKIIEAIPDKKITKMFEQSISVDSSLSIIFISNETNSSRISFVEYLDLSENDWNCVYFDTEVFKEEATNLSKKFKTLGFNLYSMDIDFLNNENVTLNIDITEKKADVTKIQTLLKNIFDKSLVLDEKNHFDIENFDVKSNFFIL